MRKILFIALMLTVVSLAAPPASAFTHQQIALGQSVVFVTVGSVTYVTLPGRESALPGGSPSSDSLQGVADSAYSASRSVDFVGDTEGDGGADAYAVNVKGFVLTVDDDWAWQ